MADEYTAALAKARGELLQAETLLKSADATIATLQGTIETTKNSRVRMLGEVDRLSRLVQSLISAGGSE